MNEEHIHYSINVLIHNRFMQNHQYFKISNVKSVRLEFTTWTAGLLREALVMDFMGALYH